MLTKEQFSQIKQIIYDAGKLIENVDEITNQKDIKSKGGISNIVTKYDSMVQAYLVEKLGTLLPDAHFLGEEDGMSDTDTGNGYVFIIDPIDGTTNFVCGFMLSAISVGVALDGKLIAGFVYNPFRNEMFYGIEGMGAYLNDKPISIHDKSLKDSVVIFGQVPYNPELRDAAYELSKAVTYKTMDLRELGVASLCLCYAACNRCAVYASPRLSVWDYAGAYTIIKEAGGELCSFDGSPLKLRSKVSVLGGAKTALSEFLELSKQTAERFI